MANARKKRTALSLNVESLDDRAVPAAFSFGGFFRQALIQRALLNREAFFSNFFSTANLGLGATNLSLGTTIPRPLPSQITSGASANQVFNTFKSTLNNINTQFTKQINALNQLNTNLTNQVQSQIQSAVSQNAAAVNAGQTPPVDLATLTNTLGFQLTAQQNLISGQVQSLNQALNNEFNTLTSTYGKYGPAFQSAISQAFAGFNNNLAQFGSQVGTGLGNLTLS